MLHDSVEPVGPMMHWSTRWRVIKDGAPSLSEKDRYARRRGFWTGTMTTIPTLRVARPTDDLDALLPFYREGLGFVVLYRFEGHDGFDGVMLGLPDAPYHLEFTRHHLHKAGRAPTNDNLLVLYMPEAAEWQAAVDRMQTAGFSSVPAFNPYWDQNGRTFEDPDGYRVVLQNSAWS